MTQPASLLPRHDPPGLIHTARVARVLPGRHVDLRSRGEATPRRAALTVVGYQASVGDRVVWTESDTGEALVIGVLAAKASPVLVANDGARAALEEGELVVRAPDGTPLVRYDPVSKTLRFEAAEGDIILAAPRGRVVLAARDELAMTAGTRAHLEAPTVEVTARQVALRADEGTLRVERVATTMTKVVHRVGHFCLEAEQIVERAVDTLREVEGLAETRAGRARLLVAGLSQLLAKRTAIVSEEDTSVDGKRVLLG